MRALHIGFSININMDIKNYGIRFSESSVISLVPTLLIDLIKNPHSLKNLKKLRCIILSGAKVPMKLLSDCKKNNLNIFISYGMTETCSSICGFWLLKNNNPDKSVGRPFNGVDIDSKDNKIIIKSAVYQNKSIIKQISENFGKQAVIVSIDVKKNAHEGTHSLWSDCGRVLEKVGLHEHISHCVNEGAGEILINSIDADGTMKGYDVSLIKSVVESVKIPVIGCGGAGNFNHLRDTFLNI